MEIRTHHGRFIDDNTFCEIFETIRIALQNVSQQLPKVYLNTRILSDTPFKANV